MLSEERRARLLPFWAGLISLIAIYYLTENAWKAVIIGAFVGGSALLGYGARWVLMGSFAIAVFAIAVALGLPMPDQWPHVIDRTIFRFRTAL
jgi:uncharacterized membrane protein YjjB (DUF3815 family)